MSVLRRCTEAASVAKRAADGGRRDDRMSVQRRCRHQILISDGDRGKIGNRGLALGFRRSTVIAAEHFVRI